MCACLNYPLLTACSLLQVAGIVGRAELISAICFFLALLCYVRACDDGSSWWSMGCWLIVTTLLVGSALLFKEQGITVVVCANCHGLLYYINIIFTGHMYSL